MYNVIIKTKLKLIVVNGQINIVKLQTIYNNIIKIHENLRKVDEECIKKVSQVIFQKESQNKNIPLKLILDGY